VGGLDGLGRLRAAMRIAGPAGATRDPSPVPTRSSSLMDATSVRDALLARVPGAVYEPVPSLDYETLVVDRDHLVETVRVLRDDPELSFVLVELTAADYLPRTPRFEVVYHFVRLGMPGQPRSGPTSTPARLRVKVPAGGDAPSVPTVSHLFPSANWLEREVWDLFGIAFEGHPDLRRLLLLDDWEGHPLRKDYPVQVKVPYRSTEPVQLTEEEFVANIQRQRQAAGRRDR
jgi:NADH-quinone oxidoreductase subunit C